VSTVLDAGALIAFDRGDRDVQARIAVAQAATSGLVTVAPVVGQAWRNGARQAWLARMLHGIDVRGVTEADARRGGELLPAAGTGDIVDALLALTVVPGDQVLTSNPDDLAVLLDARCIEARVVRL
jgi:hypothetical protein